MERLTYRLKTGEVLMATEYEEKYTKDEWIVMLQCRLAAYEDTGLTPEEINDLASVREISPEAEYAINKHADNIIERLDKLLHQTDDDARLRDLAEADKDGRVVMLPCKVGDRLYEVTGRKTISVYKVRAIRVELFGLFIEWDIVEGFVWQSLAGINAGEIGKTVFLTREEAEKELEEQDGNQR
jgi:hypothetical protein